ncbi:hypothetical protein A8B75_18800 [Sphingomonadales bacterium EhC05]|nr:hypothetical protein A8B75_18800 [Sphingomonadales bacterium EhC05]
MIIMKPALSVLIASTFLAGCSTLQPPLRQMAVDSNRLAAEAADQQTLLNILRAKDRLPMHFSSFRYIRGNLQVTTQAGLGGSLVEQGTQILTKSVTAPAGKTNEIVNTLSNGVDTFTPSLGVAVVSNPNFEMAVFDTKEFQSGISTPVKPSLIEFFLSQGWPEDFLTAIFTATVDMEITPEAKIFGDQEVVSTFHIKNDPKKAKNNEDYDFGKFISFFEMVHVEKEGTEKEVTDLELVSDLNLGDIAILDGSKFDIKKKALPRKNVSNELLKKDVEESICSVGSKCVVRKIKGGRGISLKVRSGIDENGESDKGQFPEGRLKVNLVRKLVNLIPLSYKSMSYLDKPNTMQAKQAYEKAKTKYEESTAALNKRADSEIKEIARKDSENLNNATKNYVYGKILEDKDNISLDLQCKDIKIFDEYDIKNRGGCIIFMDNIEVAKLSITAVIRSPQSIIYYLGKYARYGDDSVYQIHKTGIENTQNKCGTFVIRLQEGLNDDSIISTKHLGKYYSINKTKRPEGCDSVDHRGSQAIALVQQLVNLQKSAESLPSTTAIQITP